MSNLFGRVFRETSSSETFETPFYESFNFLEDLFVLFAELKFSDE